MYDRDQIIFMVFTALAFLVPFLTVVEALE